MTDYPPGKWSPLLVELVWPSGQAVNAMHAGKTNRTTIQMNFDNYGSGLDAGWQGPLADQQGWTAEATREKFRQGAEQARKIAHANGVYAISYGNTINSVDTLRNQLTNLCERANKDLEESANNSKLPLLTKVGQIAERIAIYQREAFMAYEACSGAILLDALQPILDEQGNEQSFLTYTQAHGAPTGKPQPDHDAIETRVRYMLQPRTDGGKGQLTGESSTPAQGEGGAGGSTAATPVPMRGGAILPSSGTPTSPVQTSPAAFGAPAATNNGAIPTSSGTPTPPAQTPPAAFGAPAATNKGAILPASTSPAAPLPSPASAGGGPAAGSAALAASPSALASTPSAALPASISPITLAPGLANSGLSAVPTNVTEAASVTAASHPTPQLPPSAATFPAAAPGVWNVHPIEQPPPPPVPPPAEAAPPMLASPAAPAAAVPTGPPPPAGPLPAYGSDIRPPAVAASAPSAPLSPPPPTASAASVHPSASALSQPAVARTTPSPTPQAQTVAAAGGAIAGAASAEATARTRLHRLVTAVARQQPRLSWAAGDRPDGTTVLVTDLASGWIPPGIDLPAVATLLDPARRRGDLHTLLGAVTVAASYTPIHYLPDPADEEPVPTSPRPWRAPEVEELGWQLNRVTHWRDGLTQLAHTLAKAASRGTGVIESEIDLLHEQLAHVGIQVLDGYPDHVDPERVGDWQLLAAIDALVAGDRTVANYHLSWFLACNSTAAQGSR
jgi:hypothetical protein